MHKFIKLNLFVLSLFVALSIAPKPSAGFEVVAELTFNHNPYKAIQGWKHSWDFWDAMACIVTLPVCALDDSKDAPEGYQVVTREKLEKADYSAEKIDGILSSQKALSELLEKENKKIELSDS